MAEKVEKPYIHDERITSDMIQVSTIDNKFQVNLIYIFSVKIEELTRNFTSRFYML